MTEIMDSAERNRYEMDVDGSTAFVTYTRQGNRITLEHTEVPEALAGRGVGSKLASAVLNDIRHRGLRVVPHCEFIAGYIRRHPEFADIVAS